MNKKQEWIINSIEKDLNKLWNTIIFTNIILLLTNISLTIHLIKHWIK